MYWQSEYKDQREPLCGWGFTARAPSWLQACLHPNIIIGEWVCASKTNGVVSIVWEMIWLFLGAKTETHQQLNCMYQMIKLKLSVFVIFFSLPEKWTVWI